MMSRKLLLCENGSALSVYMFCDRLDFISIVHKRRPNLSLLVLCFVPQDTLLISV